MKSLSPYHCMVLGKLRIQGVGLVAFTDGTLFGRVFYYPGAQFDVSLLIQAFIMIAIQLVLLKVALDHRPGPSSKGGEAATPFASGAGGGFERPYQFWQWRSPKP